MTETGLDNRIVLPQWLDFRKAAEQREAYAFERELARQDYGPSIAAFTEAFADFEREPSPFVATELMGIAHVLRQDDTARRLAEYVLSQSIVGLVALNQARRILGDQGRAQSTDLHERVKITKSHVRQFPRDAIAWLEQARLYTILGQRYKARVAIMAALQLAPTHRYIVRSAIRFFMHFDWWDDALRCAERAYAATSDPLILGPLLSVATHLQKLPQKLKLLAQSALNAPNHFLFSETLEAIGTLEIIYGAEKKSRRFFKRAWIDPAKAVISHSQWVLREHLPGLATEQRIDFSQSPEALSWLRYAVLDLRGAIAGTQEWELEEPYARRPNILGSSIACVADDFTGAEAIAKRGLKANPHDVTLINNLAFAQLRSGRVADAENTFAPLKQILSEQNQIAPIATYGLLLMSQGHFDEGVAQYVEAVNRAKSAADLTSATRATLNLLISMFETAKKLDPVLLKATSNALKAATDPGCFATGISLARKLAKANISGSDPIATASREFIECVQIEKNRFLNSVFACLLPRIASSSVAEAAST
jgi:tetratricopeptide (TPR) repeat protein